MSLWAAGRGLLGLVLGSGWGVRLGGSVSGPGVMEWVGGCPKCLTGVACGTYMQ